MRKMTKLTNQIVISCTLLSSIHSAFAEEKSKLVVHEWGTTTSMYTSFGAPQIGLNGIFVDGQLPPFVHKLDAKNLRFKALRKGGDGLFDSEMHYDVIMRLETPVMYFYPKGEVENFSVTAHFLGGLLNEYYPDAKTTQEKFLTDEKGSVRIKVGESRSSLTWDNIAFSKNPAPGPATENKVWLAPRNVKSRPIKMPNGEEERYLFYRGVAALPPLFRATLKEDKVEIEPPSIWPLPEVKELNVRDSWILTSQEAGSAAINVGAIKLTSASKDPLATVKFPVINSKDLNVEELKAQMKVALVAQGLFEDEAQAMLNTWKESYFDKQGKRILFILPKEWVEHYLPLEISVPSEVTRVYVGRIDFLY